MTTPPTGPNRRGKPRVRITSLVGYSHRRDDMIFATLGTAQALDVSESGLRLRVHEPLPVGGEMRFELILAGAIHGVLGRIVWGEELEPDRVYEFGIRFVEIDDPTREAFRKAIEVKLELGEANQAPGSE